MQGVDTDGFTDCRRVSLSVEAFQHSKGITGEDVEQCDRAVDSFASWGLDMGVASAEEQQGREEEVRKPVHEATHDGLSAAGESEAKPRAYSPAKGAW